MGFLGPLRLMLILLRAMSEFRPIIALETQLTAGRAAWAARLIAIPIGVPMTVRGPKMGILSPWHLILVLLIVFLVFGPKRLGNLGRQLGTNIRELKNAVTGASKRK